MSAHTVTDEEKVVATRIGKAIVRLRKAAGLTQQDLADLVEIDRTYVAYLESGARTPSLGLVARLAYVLGVDVSEFFADLSKPDDQERALVAAFRRLDRGMRARAVGVLGAMRG